MYCALYGPNDGRSISGCCVEVVVEVVVINNVVVASVVEIVDSDDVVLVCVVVSFVVGVILDIGSLDDSVKDTVSNAICLSSVVSGLQISNMLSFLTDFSTNLFACSTLS